ncbi:MAG TPA: (deoxy)nucleoside triphosphate pyrophosphohydrolase [Tepidisphaeraceae bacterium]|nr:(deoxy)nucleoside triphosphate pyrophosphohydrolase [Tepidisphaeraceae bacterium]
MKQVDAAIAVVTRGGRILVCQRHDTDTLGGYWEFPGGKREHDETLEQCLARELMEELAIRATPLAQLTLIEHNYPHARIRLFPFVCELEEGMEPRAIECQAMEWIDPPRVKTFRFPPANDALLDEVVAYFTSRTDDVSLS